jgi:hypothetical protein
MPSLMRDLFFKTKYKILFLQKINETYWIKKSITKNDFTKFSQIGEHKIVCDINQPAYIRDNYRIYICDYNSGFQMHLNSLENQTGLTLEQLDEFVNVKIIGQLTRSSMTSNKEKILMFILGAVIGALLAGLICYIALTKQYDTKIADLISSLTPTQGL